MKVPDLHICIYIYIHIWEDDYDYFVFYLNCDIYKFACLGSLAVAGGVSKD